MSLADLNLLFHFAVVPLVIIAIAVCFLVLPVSLAKFERETERKRGDRP